jgi:hypothetical protein
MNKYICHGFRSVNADSMSEAAQIFAGRSARQNYGRNGCCRTCTMGAYSQDGRLAEYSAFIGRKTGPNETTGHNIHFTVYQLQSAPGK